MKMLSMCLLSASLVLAGAAPAAHAESKNPTGGSKVGQACTVTGGGAGSNQGKSGTYTNDVDGLNCSGSWGSSACTVAGKPNCADKARTIRPGTIATFPTKGTLTLRKY